MLEKILWILCLLNFFFTECAWSQTPIDNQPSEIAVTAEAEILYPYQISEFTFTLEATGEKSVDLDKKLSNQLEEIKSKLKDIAILSHRIELEPELKSAKLIIESQAKSSSSLANALDTLKSLGAHMLGKIKYSYSNEQDEAIKSALNVAKNKAEKIASNLGVKLGSPISIIVADEPLGAVILEARQLGGPIDPATMPQRNKITVQARFAIN